MLSRKRLFAIITILSVAFFFLHAFYNQAGGNWLFEASGGVHKLSNGWTELGGIRYCWTTPLYLPGCLVFYLGQRLHGLRSRPQPYGAIGILLLASASVVSFWSLASALQSVILRRKELLGIHSYRLALAIAGWIWVCVPIEWTWVYQWTVVH